MFYAQHELIFHANDNMPLDFHVAVRIESTVEMNCLANSMFSIDNSNNHYKVLFTTDKHSQTDDLYRKFYAIANKYMVTFHWKYKDESMEEQEYDIVGMSLGKEESTA